MLLLVQYICIIYICTLISLIFLFAPTPTYAFKEKLLKSGTINSVHISGILRNRPIIIIHMQIYIVWINMIHDVVSSM